MKIRIHAAFTTAALLFVIMAAVSGVQAQEAVRCREIATQEQCVAQCCQWCGSETKPESLWQQMTTVVSYAEGKCVDVDADTDKCEFINHTPFCPYLNTLADNIPYITIITMLSADVFKFVFFGFLVGSPPNRMFTITFLCSSVYTYLVYHMAMWGVDFYARGLLPYNVVARVVIWGCAGLLISHNLVGALGMTVPWVFMLAASLRRVGVRSRFLETVTGNFAEFNPRKNNDSGLCNALLGVMHRLLIKGIDFNNYGGPDSLAGSLFYTACSFTVWAVLVLLIDVFVWEVLFQPIVVLVLALTMLPGIIPAAVVETLGASRRLVTLIYSVIGNMVIASLLLYFLFYVGLVSHALMVALLPGLNGGIMLAWMVGSLGDKSSWHWHHSFSFFLAGQAAAAYAVFAMPTVEFLGQPDSFQSAVLNTCLITLPPGVSLFWRIFFRVLDEQTKTSKPRPEDLQDEELGIVHKRDRKGGDWERACHEESEEEIVVQADDDAVSSGGKRRV